MNCVKIREPRKCDIYTADSAVRHVHRERAIEGSSRRRRVKVPEMLKVVMVLAFATPVMSACFMAAVALLSPAAPQHCSLDPVQPGLPVRSAARLLT